MMTMTGPSQAFVDLCETLYGCAVDPYAVWSNVEKAAPDQTDLHVQRQAKVRRNFERASNAIGLTAAGMATGAALRDDRFKEGGKVARALYRTGQKIPAPISRIGGKKGALLAGGALAVQGVNMAGDVAIGQTLGKKPAKEKTSKRLAPTGVSKKAAGFPDLKKVVQGLRTAWNPNYVPAAAQAAPAAGTRAAAKQAQAGKKTAASTAKHAAQGADAARMLSTTSGKAVTGTLAAGATYAGAKKVGTKRSYEYVDDTSFTKSDDGVVFKGTFTDFDDSKRQAFGWASVVKINGVPVVDRQGDYIDLDDLESAAYTYVHKSRVGGDMHRRNGDAPHHVSDMIESIVFSEDKCKALNLPDDFPRGWWVGYQIHDPATWEEVRKKGRTGFSIHGRGIRKDVDVDELMGAH